MKFRTAIGLLSIAPSAFAADNAVTDSDFEKFKLALGGYLVGYHKTELSATSPYLIGTNINLQDDLGMDTQTRSFRVDSYYRFNPQHRIEFSYYSIYTKSIKETERDLNWQDVTFEAGAVIDSYLNMDIFKLNYAYTFYNSEQVELSLGVGAHMISTSTGLSGKATVDGETVTDSNGSTKFLAPLPVIGFSMTYNLSDKWQVIGSLDYFGLAIDDFSGYFTDLKVVAEYQAFENVGLGIGLNSTTLNLQVNKDFKYRVDQGVTGVLVYASYRY